jgi:uncharacterized protein DUF4349
MPDHDLEELLRAVKPEPAPAWVGRMDRRVEQRFPSPPRWWHWQRLRIQVLALGSAACILLVFVGFVALVSNGTDDSGDSMSSGSGGSSSAAAPAKAPPPESATSDSAAAAPQSRAQIKDVSITLSTTPDGVEDVSDKVIRVADTFGGYVQDSSIRARQSAEITLKVPADKLDRALAQLSRLAHVSARTQETEDVTDQKAALDARVRDARAYRDSLQRRLARATTDREASSLRGRLQRAEQRLRSAQRSVVRLSRETSYATIDVGVNGNRSGAAPAAPAGRWTPGDALRDAGRVLEVIAGILLIAGAIVLPIVLIGAVGAAVGRIVARRRRERALEAV